MRLNLRAICVIGDIVLNFVRAHIFTSGKEAFLIKIRYRYSDKSIKGWKDWK